jgi:aspartate aminotransferase-like enzyme
VFAPHVETSAGLMLPDDYLRGLADAVHAHDGLLVLDCIASGAAWVDMRATGVDILLSAPQKGWSATPCAGLVMLSDRARARIDGTQSSSFSLDLKKWLSIMETYESGAHAYHATLPTDGLASLRDVMSELRGFGFARAREAQFELGRRVRAMFAERGITSVAAPGFEAPACRWPAMKDRISAPSAWAFLASTSGRTWIARWRACRRRWIGRLRADQKSLTELCA